MKELDCGLVADLLPLYVENMLSESTKQTVGEHLLTCESCAQKCRDMRADVPKVQAEENLKKAAPLKHLLNHMVLVLLGFPLWLPLLLSGAVVVLALYIALLSVLIALWCVPVSLGVCALSAAVSIFFAGSIGKVIFLFGCAALCGGLAFASYIGCLNMSGWMVRFTKYLLLKFKYLIHGKDKYDEKSK